MHGGLRSTTLLRGTTNISHLAVDSSARFRITSDQQAPTVELVTYPIRCGPIYLLSFIMFVLVDINGPFCFIDIQGALTLHSGRNDTTCSPSIEHIVDDAPIVSGSGTKTFCQPLC